IADRDDLLVTIAPGAGHGAPACFLPALATIEVDGVHFGHVDPSTAKPHLMSDRARYAPAWGALTHECAHSCHTRWTPPPDAETAPLAATIETVLGAEKLRELRALWRAAFTVADDDADAMIDLGRRWRDLVGPDPRATTPPASPSGEPGTPGTPGASSPLADA